MTAYDRWLERPYQERAAEEDEFNEIFEDLLLNELNPKNPDVFMEAIIEGDCIDNKDFYAALKEHLTSKNFQALGELIYDYVADYCDETAESRAEAIYTMRRRSTK